ncbi:uncharacterized protein LOC111077726 [Drosophila obscura]|uniref:uncharacterized protein LOC111077726 n=1 Tax=Drosophila obscura TaxID=7282 RepID=UPI001BB1F178|nr:uncharacterized protein LOC111077726 [Drosophila obscura]
MRLLFWYLLAYSGLDTAKKVNAERTDLRKLGFKNSYDKVVRDLIKNWESPIEYLQGHGYISVGFKDTSVIKPGLDAIKERIETKKRQRKKMKREMRNARGLLPRGTHAMNQLDIMLEKIKQKDATRKNRLVDNNKQSMIYPGVGLLMAMGQTGHKQDEQERQLLEMKQRLVSMPASRLRQDQAAATSKPPGHRFDKMLQQMMKQASPPMQQPEQASAVDQANTATHNAFGANPNAEEAPQLTPALKSGSTYGAESIPNVLPVDTLDPNRGQTGRSEDERAAGTQLTYGNPSKDVEAPSYLNWDIEKKHFIQYSPVVKEAYVNKLVRMFVEKEKLREKQIKLHTAPP